MNPLHMAAENARLNDYFRHVVFQLDITPTGARNLINGDVGTIPAGVSLASDFKMGDQARSLKFVSSSIGGVTFQHRPEYAPGTKDFTVEAMVKVDDFISLSEVHPGSPNTNKIFAIMAWHEWSAEGKNENMWFLLDDTLGQTRFNSNGLATIGVPYPRPFPKNDLVHVANVRRDGVMYSYVNGMRIGQAADARDYQVRAVDVLRIGGRRGGTSGNLWWRAHGTIAGFRIAHTALYRGESFVPPTSFKRQ